MDKEREVSTRSHDVVRRRGSVKTDWRKGCDVQFWAYSSFAVCALICVAQTDAPLKVATDLTKTEMDAYLKRAQQEGISDQNLRVVEIGPYVSAGSDSPTL